MSRREARIRGAEPQAGPLNGNNPSPTETVQDGLLLEKSRLCQTRVVLNDLLLVADHGDLFTLGLTLKLCVQLLNLNVQVCRNLG